MLTTVRGTYQNGQIIWKEKPPVQEPTEVIVTFLEGGTISKKKQSRQGGTMKGEVWMANDFNASLDDLKDYM